MTHDEEIEQIQARLAALVRFTADVTMDIRRELDALKQPQESKMTRALAIEKALSQVRGMLGGRSRMIAFGRMCEVRFVRKNTKITCILSADSSGEVIAVGRSWCAKGDAYNQIIGKLIALYRALGREVPEWLLHIPQE